MSDECPCPNCQGDGYHCAEGHENALHLIPLPDGLFSYIPLVTSKELSQAACIEELLEKIGYLPEGLAILEKHGLQR